MCNRESKKTAYNACLTLLAWMSIAPLTGEFAHAQPAGSPPTGSTVSDTKSGAAGATQSTPATKAFDPWTSPTLTGDWGGVRKQLSDDGVDINLYYNQQFQKNLRGGLDTHHAQRLSGSYDLSLRLDFGKMKLWEDAGFAMETKGTWSDGINPNKVGALANVNSDAGDDFPIFVNKWWVFKKFFDKKIELRVGRLETNKDLFDVSPYANHEDKDFINRASIRNTTIPHKTGIGAFLKFQPVDWAYFQMAAVDAQTRPRRTGFDTAFHQQDFYVAYWEGGVKAKLPSPNGELPGGYRVGGWYDPTIKEVFRDTLGGFRPAQMRGGDVGYYCGFDQMVWKESEDPKDSQGLGVFGRYGHAHQDVNKITNYWAGGVSWKGLVPERNQDVAAFAASQAILSDRLADEKNQRLDRETAYEVYYAVQVAPWYIVTPHVQFVTNPGGGKDAHDAIVAGVRMRVTF